MRNENPYRFYLEEATMLIPGILPPQGSVEWSCPSNIALVKYWGKKDNQVPCNPSLSFTLQNAVTSLKLEYSILSGNKPAPPQFFFEGKRNKLFESRVGDYLNITGAFFPFLKQLSILVKSENNFPVSTGIASSASSFGALALALTELDYALREKLPDESFFQKASFMARLGSGSACRSIYGGYVLWGYAKDVAGSSDNYALSINHNVHEVFKNYCDAILIITKEKKQVSSSEGHRLMNSNPYAGTRFTDARFNIPKLLKILSSGEQTGFIKVIEGEALALHAMMMTSKPYYLLLKPQTVAAIHKIWQFRKRTGYKVCFTLDAGANLHLLYPAALTYEIKRFIDDGLRDLCENGEVMHDSVGDGPRKLQKTINSYG
ncbi:MAG: hypothetical protein R6W78_09790 [Bacteroidales bacterium]